MNFLPLVKDLQEITMLTRACSLSSTFRKRSINYLLGIVFLTWHGTTPAPAQGDAFDSTAATGTQTRTQTSTTNVAAYPNFYVEYASGHLSGFWSGPGLNRTGSASAWSSPYLGPRTIEGSNHPVLQGATNGTIGAQFSKSGKTPNRAGGKLKTSKAGNSPAKLRSETGTKELEQKFKKESAGELCSQEITSDKAAQSAIFSECFPNEQSDPDWYNPQLSYFDCFEIESGIAYYFKSDATALQTVPAIALGLTNPSDECAGDGPSKSQIQAYYTARVSPIIKACAAPLLQGCETPVAPRKKLLPSLYIPKSDRYSSFAGLNKIVFTEPGLNYKKIQTALKLIEAPSVCQIVPAAEKARELFSLKDSKQALLDKAASMENIRVERVRHYKVVSTLKDDLAANPKAPLKLRTVVWAEVYTELPCDAAKLARIHVRAAELENDKSRKFILKGKAACLAKNWAIAWQEFESAYALKKESPDQAREIASIYLNFKRSNEASVWLTRYLRIAPDWEGFQLAFFQRNTLEQEGFAEALKKEPANIAWDTERMPLRVYMGNLKLNENTASKNTSTFKRSSPIKMYDQRLTRAMRYAMDEWRTASGDKLSFVETNNETDADIRCFWNDTIDRYENADKSFVALSRPVAERLAETYINMPKNESGKERIKQSTISVLANQAGAQRAIDELVLRHICIHELGHALGVRKHLLDIDDVMYPSCNENHPKPYLHDGDIKTIAELYKNHPVLAPSMEQFIRKHSTPIQETDEDGETLILVDSNTIPAPLGLILERTEEGEYPLVPFSLYELGLVANVSAVFP